MHHFGLDCGMLEFFKYFTSSLEQLLTLPHFCEKDCGLCPYNPSTEEVGGFDGFLYDAAQNFEVCSNIQN
jgi:hypothetical protein